ncbi:type II toxin-antitoxin system PrlF family antitoxin [Klebsiella pneumoniae]
MAAHPARVRAIPSTLLARGAALVKGVEVDLDAALPDDDA